MLARCRDLLYLARLTWCSQAHCRLSDSCDYQWQMPGTWGIEHYFCIYISTSPVSLKHVRKEKCQNVVFASWWEGQGHVGSFPSWGKKILLQVCSFHCDLRFKLFLDSEELKTESQRICVPCCKARQLAEQAHVTPCLVGGLSNLAAP